MASSRREIAATDDWHHRVVVIDRRTKRIVWQYGHNGTAGCWPGYLSKPDGLQLAPVSARSTPRWGGPAGNELLTSAAAVRRATVLLIAKASRSSAWAGWSPSTCSSGWCSPPVLLKLASTGYRFVRYYAHSLPYRAKGPPLLPLRLLAPGAVVTTVVVLGSGVWLMALGHRSDAVLELHKVSFIVWGVVFGVHFLAHVPTMLRALRPGDVPGASVRALLVAGSLGAGVALALSVLSLAGACPRVGGGPLGAVRLSRPSRPGPRGAWPAICRLLP